MNKYITCTQLKAARNILNLGVRDIGLLLKVSKDTINKAELGKTRDFFHKNSAGLIDFFERYNITFPTEYSIRYQPPKTDTQISLQNKNVLSRFQLKTARLVLSINQSDLAKAVSVAKRVITRLEKLPNDVLINPRDQDVVLKLKIFFEQHNIEFPDPFYVFFKKYVDSCASR